MRCAHPNLLPPYTNPLTCEQLQNSIVLFPSFSHNMKPREKNKSNTIRKISEILMLRAKSFQACMFLCQFLAQGPTF